MDRIIGDMTRSGSFARLGTDEGMKLEDVPEMGRMIRDMTSSGSLANAAEAIPHLE